MKTTLLVLALNELEGMRVIMPKIQRDWVDEILVVDGGSTDGTIEYAESLGIKVVRQKTKGIHAAYWEGLAVATGDVIIPFSPDGNSVAEKIPELVAKMREGYDMVIVSRYLDGAKSEDDNIPTAIGNWFFTTLINVLFGGHYTDSLVMFRAWKRSLVDEFLFPPTIAGFEPQLAIECVKRGRKVTEIPGDEPKRISGERKTDPYSASIKMLRLIAKEWWS